MREKILIFILGFMAFTGRAMAVRAPVDAQGHALATIDMVGAFPCTINGANQSILASPPIICTQGSTLTITPSVVYGVITSSIAQTAYLVFRDTIPSLANSAASLAASTAVIVWNYDVQLATAGTLFAGGKMIKFPVPIQFKNGIAVNVDSAFSGSQANWTILYRPLDSTTVGN